MRVDYAIPDDYSGIQITLAPDDDIDALLLKQFDCATPTFHLEDSGSLVATLVVAR